jgi:fucose permease
MKKNNLLIPTSYLVVFINGIYLAAYQFCVLRIAVEFSMNSTQMGAIVAVQYASMILIPLLFGRLSDYVGKKKMMLVSASCMAVGLIGMFLSTGVWVLVFSVFIAGSGSSATECLSNASLADMYPEKKDRYIGFMQAIFSLGAVLGPQIVSQLASLGFGWRQIFMLLSILVVGMGVMVFSSSIQKSDQHPHANTQALPLKKILASPLCWLVAFSFVLYVGIETGTASFAGAYFTDILHSPDMAANALSLFWLFMIPSRLIGSFMKRRLSTFVIICFSLCALVLGMLVFIREPLVCMICIGLVGFFCGPVWAALICLGQDAFPQSSGTISSICFAATGAGGALIPLLGGGIADAFSMVGAYLFFAILTILCLGLYLLLLRFVKRNGG